MVLYDIRDDHRLRRVHSVAKDFGYPLQYSVFVCDLSPSELIGLQWAMGEEIDHLVDSVVLVDLGEVDSVGSDAFTFMGRYPGLPSGGPTVL